MICEIFSIFGLYPNAFALYDFGFTNCQLDNLRRDGV